MSAGSVFLRAASSWAAFPIPADATYPDASHGVADGEKETATVIPGIHALQQPISTPIPPQHWRGNVTSRFGVKPRTQEPVCVDQGDLVVSAASLVFANTTACMRTEGGEVHGSIHLQQNSAAGLASIVSFDNSRLRVIDENSIPVCLLFIRHDASHATLWQQIVIHQGVPSFECPETIPSNVTCSIGISDQDGFYGTIMSRGDFVLDSSVGANPDPGSVCAHNAAVARRVPVLGSVMLVSIWAILVTIIAS